MVVPVAVWPRAYRITFRDGRVLRCIHIEPADAQIFCEIRAGQRVGLPRALIVRIEEIPESATEPEPDRPSSVQVPETAPHTVKPFPAVPAGERDRAAPPAVRSLLQENRRRYRTLQGAYSTPPQDAAARATLGRLAVTLARIYLDLGWTPEARAWLDVARYWQPEDPERVFQEARLAFLERRFLDAERGAREVLRRNPDHREALILMGDLAEARDRLDDAIRYWSRALDLKADPQLRARVARARVELGRIRAYRSRATRHFQLRYSGDLSETLQQDLLQLLESSYREVVRLLRLDVDEPIPVRVYTQTDYRTLLEAPDWSGAAYDGIVHLPVQGLAGDPVRLRRSLRHELCHALITRHSGNRAPPWLQEGMAQWCEFMDDRAQIDQEFHQLVKRYGIPPAALVARPTYGNLNRWQAQVLYRTAYGWVQFLRQRYRAYALRQFLRHMRNGMTWEKAFRKAYGQEFGKLYALWRLQKRTGP